ncbi:MAG: hypothetical protein M1812_000370 [Candelaria pacifica]|nr:MAG: hypothetical protein M1812_000370 [Candelaria pacifica]
MSRTDSYMSLCLDQASKSPLHYRHGCIIVRGGKVIGQGYNDYRPGFNGGALRTGRLASRGTFDRPAMAELKQRKKHKSKPITKQYSNAKTMKKFTPFENPALSCSGGGGHIANTPLSMHSEMMVIYCALSLSNTLASQGSARSAAYFEKPCYSLQNSGKRGKARLRGLKKYVSAVCQATEVSTGTGKHSETKLQIMDKEPTNKEVEENAASLKENSGEKHRMKKGYKYHHDHGLQAVQQPQQQPNGIKEGTQTFPRARSPPAVEPERQTKTQPARSINKNRKMKTANGSENQHVQTLLLPQGPTGQASRKVTERQKDPRLKGADLYVARLGWKLPESSSEKRVSASIAEAIDHANVVSMAKPPEQVVSQSQIPSSLHDELSPSTLEARSTHRISPSLKSESLSRDCVGASRPCYRCISYMHSVGIKRVFWTNEKGEWDGGKVRDLVDALENPDPIHADNTAGGLFVTKHEVLMLRRLMALP